MLTAERRTRAQHLAWAKERALEINAGGDYMGAFSSLASDLNKHPETRGHIGLSLGMRLMLGGHLRDAEAMEKWIEGFH